MQGYVQEVAGSGGRSSAVLIRVLWAGAVACSLALFAANFMLGDLNQDEGWYLYAARLVSEGQLPYIDFASTQGPVMPFVYALVQPVLGGLGVAGGRLFTALLGFCAALCAGWLASRLVAPERRGVAGLLGFMLAGINVYQCYFCTLVKTYALAGLCVTAGFLLLTYGGRRGRGWADFFAGVFLALATGARTSAAAALAGAFVILYVVGLRGRGPEARGLTRQAVCLAFGALLMFVLMYLPFAWKAPDALWFALVDYHAGRDVGGLLKALAYKAGFVSRVTQAYFVAVALAVSAGVVFLARRRAHAAVPGAPAPILLCLWGAVVLVSALHFMAPFPYDDYQALIYPIFAAAVAAAVLRVAAPAEGAAARAPQALAVGVFLLCVAGAVASPMNMEWFVAKRDRIFFPLKTEYPLAKLQRVAREIRAMPGVERGAVLLTQDPYLAVETGLRLPPGLELGPFSYFPDWSDEKARACRVMNQAMLRELLESCEAPVAAFSGYGLAIRLPEVTPLSAAEQGELWGLVEKRYKPDHEEADFGQAATTLKILTRK